MGGALRIRSVPGSIAAVRCRQEGGTTVPQGESRRQGVIGFQARQSRGPANYGAEQVGVITASQGRSRASVPTCRKSMRVRSMCKRARRGGRKNNQSCQLQAHGRPTARSQPTTSVSTSVHAHAWVGRKSPRGGEGRPSEDHATAAAHARRARISLRARPAHRPGRAEGLMPVRL